MSKNTKDQFGNRMKNYEKVFTEIKVDPSEVLCVRLDGKGFSKFTKGFTKPFDERMTKSMVQTAEMLVKETNPQIAYTQSDEISLIYTAGEKSSEHIYGGKVSKINSILAAIATAHFNKFVTINAPDIVSSKGLAYFDCRSFSVPELVEASNVILWRNQDAKKNSISCLMRWTCGHKAMQDMNGEQMKNYMLSEKNVDWNKLPNEWKYGVFSKKEKYETIMDEEQWNKIPENKKPDSRIVIRSRVVSESPKFYGDFSLAERINMITSKSFNIEKEVSYGIK